MSSQEMLHQSPTGSKLGMDLLIDASLAATFGDRPTGFNPDGSFGGNLGISQIPEQGRRHAERVLGSLNGFHYIGSTAEHTEMVEQGGMQVPMQTRRTVYTKVLDK